MARNKVFKVADHVEKLAADFRPWVAWSGPIAEPSQDRLNAWTVGMSELAAEYSFTGDPNDMVAIAEFMAEMDTEKLDEQAERTAVLFADLCNNEPNVEQILELPPRARQAFYGYLSGELNPEGSAPAGTR